MNATQSLSSIGFICQTLQKPYGAIRKAIEELGISPVMVMNCVAHYADDDVERIREFLSADRTPATPKRRQTAQPNS
jgi:hypothetical protein